MMTFLLFVGSLIGVSFLAAIAALLDDKRYDDLIEQTEKGELMFLLDDVLRQGEIVHTKKDVVFIKRKNPFTIWTDGRVVKIKRKTKLIVTLEKKQTKDVSINAARKLKDTLLMFQPKVNQFYQRVTANYQQEKGDASHHFANLLNHFEKSFSLYLKENVVNTIHSGPYTIKHAKSEDEYTVNVYYEENKLWNLTFNQSLHTDKFNDIPSTSDLIEKDKQLLEEHIKNIKSIIEKNVEENETVVDKKMKDIKEKINDHEDAEELIEQVNKIYDEYHSLSVKMKEEKEHEILSLLDKLFKKEIKKVALKE